MSDLTKLRDVFEEIGVDFEERHDRGSPSTVASIYLAINGDDQAAFKFDESGRFVGVEGYNDEPSCSGYSFSPRVP